MTLFEPIETSGPLIGDPDELVFIIVGKPEPAGSKTAFRTAAGTVGVRDANKASKPWKRRVADVAAEVMAGRELLVGALEARMTFYIQRPKGHYRTDGRSLNAVGERNPRPTTRPDVLKLARAVEDALTGVIWRDDAQVVREVLEKHYGAPVRCVVEIRHHHPDGGSA
jgi:Holliday junction resolvase RusA-like endonuclease